nr:uncharacterized protein LOC123767912 isoform X2 [Procambarus clarkii]XP_045613983.1 uncharacterized protein LOC123767912 isoform X2 [Procambarus clarkii]XP_045613984.1 uncharacterized protein LOC123767912 isoform X2 [Procambarus clarkii]
MEEKVVDGKEKKYVLYTVVGEERGRAGVGVWVVRVLLGTLLLVALAVVPYLSLRLAQVSDRTLVVFQPVPVRNHSLHHHQHHTLDHTHLGHLDVVSVLQSAALTRENYTAEAANTTLKAAIPANTSTAASTAGGIVTLHESAVTLAVMEDTNATRNRDDDASDVEGDDDDDDDDSEKTVVEVEKKEPEENSTTEESVGTSEAPASVAQVAAVTVVASPSTPPVVLENTTTSLNTTTTGPAKDSNLTSITAAVSTAAPTSTPPTTQPSPNTTAKVPATMEAKVAASSTASAPNSTSSATLPPATPTRRLLAHKLVYVATTASGNHIGGFCVWKTDKAITHWSFFYENIPIEYQSHQDSSDHEMRGMLAAVRTWAPLWNDHHVVLRSHHPTIKGSDHPTRHALTRELEKLSEGHFTYELEWRLRKTDRVVDISYCLSRLHRDYAHWYRTFQGRVDELLGQQDWAVARKLNRASISQEAFHTDFPDDSEDVVVVGEK